MFYNKEQSNNQSYSLYIFSQLNILTKLDNRFNRFVHNSNYRYHLLNNFLHLVTKSLWSGGEKDFSSTLYLNI